MKTGFRVAIAAAVTACAVRGESAGSCDANGVCEAGDAPKFPASGYFGPGDIAKPMSIPEQRLINGTEFPLVLGPSPTQCKNGCTLEEIYDWVKHSKNVIDNLLLRHGAILFRGFPVDTPELLDKFVDAFGFDYFPYVGGAAPRRQLAPKVFTTNEAPPTEKIPFHHEMAQVPKFPTKVFFHCQTPAETGGETPVLASWEIREHLERRFPDFIRRLEEGVRYIRVLPEEDDPSSPIGRGWKSTYNTSEKAQVDAKLRELNYTGEWLADGSLKTVSPVLPAVRQDNGPGRSGRRTFFNSVVAVFTGWNDRRNKGEVAVQFADGGFLDPAVVQEAVRAMDELAVAFRWQKGDVILIDNHTVMHARKPFTGKRVITASLATHTWR